LVISTLIVSILENLPHKQKLISL